MTTYGTNGFVRKAGIQLFVAGAIILTTSCGNDTINGVVDDLPVLTAEQEAVGQALVDAGILAGRAGGFANLAFAQAAESQELNGFDALAVQIAWDFPDDVIEGGRDIGWYTGVVGWIGLNIGGASAAEAFTVGLEGVGPNVVSTGSGQIGQSTSDFVGQALYHERATESRYLGTSGTFTVDQLTFDAPDVCATVAGATVDVSCAVATGTMTGSYDFDAALDRGNGAPTYSQPQTAFTLPAIRVIMTLEG